MVWVAVGLAAAWGGGVRGADAAKGPGSGADDALVAGLVRAEETGLAVVRRLDVLARGMMDLGLPGPTEEARGVFAEVGAVVDLGPEPAAGVVGEAGVELREWPLAAARNWSAVPDLWRPLMDRVAHFERARFEYLRGDHPGGDRMRFESVVDFEGVARMKTGEWRSLRAGLRLDWERAGLAEGGAGEWRITGWRTERMEWRASSRRLFVEVLDEALRPPQDPGGLRRSEHYQATVAYYRDGMKKVPHPYFAPISVNQKEGLAVADINGDGFDDIYITVRLGKNLLLMNHGDGTFTEEAAARGLDLPGHTTCALFADFDNDGDLDVMLGRSLLRSTYLENRGGKFVQGPIPKFMPMAVISMAAADYNGDGLLDVYLCTYRPAAPAGSGMAGGYGQVAKDGDFDWPDEFFSPEEAREFRRRLAEHRQKHGASALDQLGPPNVLLVNRGGGVFEPAPENAVVGLWRNSLQATWVDYNGDGRPDLYIPNDWGMNVLFRNDGPAGFVDVTAEMGLTRYGFSMGATFGDYDNDGRDDLYVSNMYSEAGRRMTARVSGGDPMFVESASGNFLYHREADGKFRQVAGVATPAVPVAKVGWSWGGCFSDFDNDGYLDLYVMSGYFTAPEPLASGLDLESNLWRTMLRADGKLARPGFRQSPEWRRVSAPDNLGPQIDMRLVGAERQGDRVLVHSLHGGERNRYFANRGGKTFEEVTGLTGLDVAADSRGFAVLDYDRDGWLDVALVNAREPLFELYHNAMPAAGKKGGVIGLRFVGGNRTAKGTNGWACRDGFGARVTVDLGDARIVREHRCGEGWSVQNSATMVIGVGGHTEAASVTVRWPSGREQVVKGVAEGTLLTVYENPADGPEHAAFGRSAYRAAKPAEVAGRARPKFAVREWDTAAKPARVRVYVAFATGSAGCAQAVPGLRRLREQLGGEGVDVVMLPVDAADNDDRLGAFARQWKPGVRLVNLPTGKRGEALLAVVQALGNPTATTLSLPTTVITDEGGRVYGAQAGVPTLSAVRKWYP